MMPILVENILTLAGGARPPGCLSWRRSRSMTRATRCELGSRPWAASPGRPSRSGRAGTLGPAHAQRRAQLLCRGDRCGLRALVHRGGPAQAAGDGNSQVGQHDAVQPQDSHQRRPTRPFGSPSTHLTIWAPSTTVSNVGLTCMGCLVTCSDMWPAGVD